MVIFLKQIQGHQQVRHFKFIQMKAKTKIKLFCILIMIFYISVFLSIIFTNLFFELKYTISPTFKLIKWTGINIILLHFLFILGLVIYKNRVERKVFFFSLLMMMISLIYVIIYFYDFL